MPKPYSLFLVKADLPDELGVLNELAYNLRWTWDQQTLALFRSLDPVLWEETHHNPVRLLGLMRQEKLQQVAADEGFMAQLRRCASDLSEYMRAGTWFRDAYGAIETPRIAYFSMEFGLTECLPIYSGGLGVLAGDHLKSASELGLPLAGVGLLYQQGYFRQYLSADGWQQETYPDNDFYNLPVRMEHDREGNPLQVTVEFPGRAVHCRVWRAQVGRVPLFLLDTNVPENQPADRKITNQLYGGDSEIRIQQEIVLGIGGMRALRALDIHVHVCHMNEGHAAFMALERMRHRMAKDGLTLEEALEVVRVGTIFTTHTPVPAGIDIFDPALIQRYFAQICEVCGMDCSYLLSLGRQNPKNPHEHFNMALLALRTTAYANGVSRLHAEVSRKMWRSNWPQVPVEEVPIDAITNGIHTRSWISSEMSGLFVRYLGPNWLRRPADQSIWEGVDRIPDVELWRSHERRKERLVAFARDRLDQQLKRRGASDRERALSSELLNPDALTIGFARRFATYKRATLLLRDPDRLRRLLNNPEAPVQFIFAGKAHPRDLEGKNLIRELVHFARREDVRKHMVFLEDYDLNLARYLVQGVDVWLNTPRRPMEASGTSGMKVIPNGGLNLSVLDGWWCEGFASDTGWSIGSGEDYEDSAYQDEVESKALYDALENSIVPLFYDRSGDGLPRRWISMVKRSMKELGPVFNTNRMVQEYTDKFYMKAAKAWRDLSAQGFTGARDLARWKERVRSHWDPVRVIYAWIERRETYVGRPLGVEADVALGELAPEDVVVQAYSGPLDGNDEIVDGRATTLQHVQKLPDGLHHYRGTISCTESGRFGYHIRIMPGNGRIDGHFSLEHMRWIEGPSPSATPRSKELSRRD